MDKTRMQRYEKEDAVSKRFLKNKKMYEDVGKVNIDYVNIDVNNAISLNDDVLKPKTREDFHRKKEINNFISNAKLEEESFVEENEISNTKKVYDINEILKDARAKKLFESNSQKKRLINTEYNILTKLDLEKDLNKEEDYSKENLRSLIDQIYGKEIEDVQQDEDLLDELRTKDFETEEKEKTKKNPIERELEKARQSHQDKEQLKQRLEEAKEETIESKELTFADKVVENTFIEEIDKLNKLEVFLVVLISLITLCAVAYVLYEMFII